MGPSPADMPKRRSPSIPAAPKARPPRAHFVVAHDIPRRGHAGADLWPDTGVWLGLGHSAPLLATFLDRYESQLFVTDLVERELRALADAEDLSDEVDYDRRASARRVVDACLITGRKRARSVPLEADDLASFDQIRAQLEALPGEHAGGHKGEASIILKASARTGVRRQIMLANDGGASVVASHRGLVTRHIGDILCELVCGENLDANDAWVHYRRAERLSAPPAAVRPGGIHAFLCRAESMQCDRCDALEAAL